MAKRCKAKRMELTTGHRLEPRRPGERNLQSRRGAGDAGNRVPGGFCGGRSSRFATETRSRRDRPSALVERHEASPQPWCHAMNAAVDQGVDLAGHHINKLLFVLFGVGPRGACAGREGLDVDTNALEAGGLAQVTHQPWTRCSAGTRACTPRLDRSTGCNCKTDVRT